jgi:hypothetical protein
VKKMAVIGIPGWCITRFVMAGATPADQDLRAVWLLGELLMHSGDDEEEVDTLAAVAAQAAAAEEEARLVSERFAEAATVAAEEAEAAARGR